MNRNKNNNTTVNNNKNYRNNEYSRHIKITFV